MRLKRRAANNAELDYDAVNDPELVGLVRRPEYETSIEGATTIAPRRSQLQLRVLRSFAIYGPMTDEELRAIPEFEHMAESTVRKRRTELFQQGLVNPIGKKPNSRGRNMLIWSIRGDKP